MTKTKQKTQSPVPFRPDEDVARMLAIVRAENIIVSRVINIALREHLTAKGYAKRRAVKSA